MAWAGPGRWAWGCDRSDVGGCGEGRGRAAVAEPSIAMPERCGIREAGLRREASGIQHAADRSSDRRRGCVAGSDRTGRVALDGTCSSDMYTCCRAGPRTPPPASSAHGPDG